MIAWHFLRADRRLVYPPHTLVEAGVTVHASSLPAARTPLEYLIFAGRYPVACRVRLSGEIEDRQGLLYATEWTCLAMADAEETLAGFARWCALQVIDLWGAPAIVGQHLKTGSEGLRKGAMREAGACADAARKEEWDAVPARRAGLKAKRFAISAALWACGDKAAAVQATYGALDAAAALAGGVGDGEDALAARKVLGEELERRLHALS